MFNFVASLIAAGLILTSGFNFFSGSNVDSAFPSDQNIKGNYPVRIANNSLGLKTTAKGIVIIDDQSGEILYGKNSQAVLPIASITKLMTALVFLDANPDWNKQVIITAADRRIGGQIYLLTGDVVTVKNLFNLMLISSTNEAAIALARISGISDFAGAMNHKAAELGMNNSNFGDPSGLNPDNRASAEDLTKLAGAAFNRQEIVSAVANKEYAFKIINTGRSINAASTDRLLDSVLNDGDYKIIGAKTGYLSEVSYCLLLKVKKNDGPQLTLALLGAETISDRWQEAKGLVDWVLRNYQWL